MNDQDRNKKIEAILDREDYREQTPRKLMAAIEEVDGHAQRSKCPYCPAPPSQFTSLENCPGFVRCENCECEFLLVPKASAILTPAASDGVKDLAIGVACERIAELINERDQALSLVEDARAKAKQAHDLLDKEEEFGAQVILAQLLSDLRRAAHSSTERQDG